MGDEASGQYDVETDEDDPVCTTEPCPLCGNSCRKTYWYSFIDDYAYSVSCESCGRFGVYDSATDSGLFHASMPVKQRVACCTRERSVHSLPPLTFVSQQVRVSNWGPRDSYTIDEVDSQLFPKLMQSRLDRILGSLCRLILERDSTRRACGLTGTKRKSFDLTRDRPLFFTDNDGDIREMLAALQQQGYVRHNLSDPKSNQKARDVFSVTMLPAGIARYEQLDQTYRQTSDQAFVAMWFSSETRDAYEQGIARAIEECGFKPLRIDQKQTLGKLCDEIAQQIGRSRFLVADTTGQRVNVYFEAGFAMGLGVPVIWTCRCDEIDKLGFDIRQYAHVLWQDPNELRSQLAKRISSTIPGAERPGP